MNQQLAQHVADVLKALAHPARLQIVDLLHSGEKSVNHIAHLLHTKQSITSRQLNLMKERGVLASRRDGPKVYYRIDNKNVTKVIQCVYDHCRTKKGATK